MKNLIAMATAVSLLFAASPANADVDASPRVPGVLTIGSDLSYPPYYSVEDGIAVGFGPELMRSLASKMGLEPDFVNTRFSQLILRLKSGHFDVVASALYITPARAQQIDFIPVFQSGNVLISRTAGFEASSLADLCGHRVGVIQGGSVVEKLEDKARTVCPDGSTITLRQFPTAPGATQALLARAVDAQVVDAAVGQQTVNHLGSRVALTSDDLLFPVSVGLGVNKDRPKVKQALVSALNAIKADDRYAELLEAYGLSEPSSVKVSKALGQTTD